MNSPMPSPLKTGFARSFDGTHIYWELHGPKIKATGRAKPHLNSNVHVFCYGLVCSMAQWRAQIRRYGQTQLCLLVDYRGHHKSSLPQSSQMMTLSACARDIAAAVENAQITQPHIVWGHSMGVNVALEYALAYPNLTKALVLCCGTVSNPFSRMFGSNALEKIVTPLVQSVQPNWPYLPALWKKITSPTKLSFWTYKYLGFNPRATPDQDIQTYNQSVHEVPAAAFFPLIAELTRGTTRGIVEKIQTPSLVIAGGSDFITPPAEQRALAAGLPKGRFVEIPAGSHNVHLDFEEYVAFKVQEFLESL